MSPHLVIFRIWLCYAAGMVCAGWLLSWMGAYRWMGVTAIALVVVCTIAYVKSLSVMDSQAKKELKADFAFTPFLILLALIVLAGSLYISAVLDSLSYRIPRMLIWLQEGKIHFIDNPDFRMNLMSPFWEFVSTPVYQAAGLRFLWIGSAISWCLLYFSFLFLATHAGVERSKLRWIAFIPLASAGFVLQAASTMNDLWAAALVAISLCFIVSFEKNKRFADIVGSALALALAANAKPHYAVLALPWVIWFFFAKSKPLGTVKWAWILPVSLLVLLCSPLPTFVSNHIHYGSYKGQAGDGGFGLGSPLLNLALGSVMMLWQLFQPPVNPLARRLESFNDSWIQSAGISDVAPRFNLSSRELSMVDNASLGLVVSLFLVIGLFLAIRNRRDIPLWLWLSSLAGLVGFLIAVSQVVPGTLGRSFLGLTVLIIPLCMAGLARLSRKQVIGASVFTLLAAVAGLVLSPSHPLWPAKTVIDSSPRLTASLGKYTLVQARGEAGKPLMESVPPDAEEIGVLATGNQSLIHIWRAAGVSRTVRLYPAAVSIEELWLSSPDYYLFVGRPESEDHYHGVFTAMERDNRFSLLRSKEFVSKLERGPEPWLLFRKNRR